MILYLNQGKSAEQTEKKKVKRLSLNKTVEVKEAGAPAEVPEEEKKKLYTTRSCLRRHLSRHGFGQQVQKPAITMKDFRLLEQPI